MWFLEFAMMVITCFLVAYLVSIVFHTIIFGIMLSDNPEGMEHFPNTNPFFVSFLLGVISPVALYEALYGFLNKEKQNDTD